MSRVIWRIMPLLTLCWIIATIDRSNVGFAKLQMTGSLGMSEAAFGLGSSLFFVGYLVFEIPSALAAHRYGARLWIARIMFTWGLATILLGFVSSASMFYLMRFTLGVAEAGLYPAALYYISLWFPQSQMARATGFFTVGSALGNASGSLIAGPLLDLNGVMGLEGWQWIFLATGILPVAVSLTVLKWVVDTPAVATFLTVPERSRVLELAARGQDAVQSGHALRVILDRRVMGYVVTYVLILVALYGVIYWSPTVIKSFGVTGVENGLLNAAPWLVAAVLLLTLMPKFKQRRSVLAVLAFITSLGAICFVVAAAANNDAIRYLALLIGTPCISLSIACFWTLPIRMFHGAHNAVAIATISTLGNLGGLIAQNLMPALASSGGGPATALWAPGICLAVIALGSLVYASRIQAQPRTAHP